MILTVTVSSVLVQIYYRISDLESWIFLTWPDLTWPDLHIFPVDGKGPVATLSVSVALHDVQVRHQGRPRVAVLTQRGPGVDPFTNLPNISQIKIVISEKMLTLGAWEPHE